jgi:hypothetical protein
MVKDVFSVTKIRQHRHQNVLRAKVDRLVRVTSQVRTITHAGTGGEHIVVSGHRESRQHRWSCHGGLSPSACDDCIRGVATGRLLLQQHLQALVRPFL